MQVRHVQQFIETWAPRQIAWERDNIGLLVGSADQDVKRILVALDITEDVIDEARRKKIDLLITHHPLIFTPVRSITTRDRVGSLVLRLARADIALYAAHTNLDFAPEGVSFVLARTLGIEKPEILSRGERFYKSIVVFVPVDHLTPVMNAMSAAGAGAIGKYDSCSFQLEGTGTFRPLEGSNPFIGAQGTLERVKEIRLEMIVPSWNVPAVVSAMQKAHPYESVAYYLYDLANSSEEYGAGAVGDLKEPVTLRAFLQIVKRRLNVPSLRHTGNLKQTVRRVAVCGGSGSDLLPAAIENRADAFVTADITYHTFQKAEGSIALIDAGHYETENLTVRKIVDFLANEFRKRHVRVAVSASQSSRNPVLYC
jgi:dinuclear metal center YbgI/SA1388 family protein